MFSGLTTRALTEVVRDVVIPDATLSGLWHISVDPIDKYTLLTKLAAYLGWSLDITPVDDTRDRPLAGQHAVPRAHGLDAAQLGRDA